MGNTWHSRGKLDSPQSCSYSWQNQGLLWPCCERSSKMLQVGQSPADPTAAMEQGRLLWSEGGSAALKQKCLLKKPTWQTTNKKPKLWFVGETTSFLPISISVLTWGLLSAPLSALCAVEDGALPPRTAHNGRSMALLRAASCAAQGKTERPHIPGANNCPQCTNTAQLRHHTLPALCTRSSCLQQWDAQGCAHPQCMSAAAPSAAAPT